MLHKFVFFFVFCWFCCILKLVYPVKAHSSPEVHSNDPKQSVIHKSQPDEQDIEDSLQILHIPAQLQAQNHVTLRYICSKPKYVGIAVHVSELNDWTEVFHRKFLCDRSTESRTKKIPLRLPDNILYKPGLFNSDVSYVKSVRLKAWIVEQNLWPRVKHDPYKYSTERKRATIFVRPPLQRPEKLPWGCLSWATEVMLMQPYSVTMRCKVQPEIINAITYPIIITGNLHGVFRQFPPFTDKDYIKEAKLDGRQTKYTVSLWLYLKEYCGWRLCSIVHRILWNDVYRTPLIYITEEGKLHIQVHTINDESEAAVTAFSLPKDEWFRLTVAFNGKNWRATIEYKDRKKNIIDTSYRNKKEPYTNDTEGYTVFGGNDMVGGFKGYIGTAVWYRGKVMDPNEIPFPSPYHPMFELGLDERTVKCSKYLNWVKDRTEFYRNRPKRWLTKNTCSSNFLDFLNVSSRIQPKCSRSRHIPREFRLVNRLIRKDLRDDDDVDFPSLANSIFKNASHMVEVDGLQATKRMVPLLKQASCFGNVDAMYMLSVILSKGVGYKADESQSHAYLMYAGLEGHRHSLLALGNKHVYGLDGLPTDLEMAFSYYKRMADISKKERDQHNNADVLTEEVRLNNKDALEAQTDEDGDVFQWVKHQAHQGVLSAQRHMAGLLFWGQQGIQRNIQAAVEYYRMGAQQGDREAMFDYGLVLLRGQGTKKDEEEGLKHLDRAASEGSHQAINTLGWHADVKERNRTKAVGYWERAYEMGNIDAAHNLGHMYFSGQYPGKQADRVKAFQYFSYAATRGQFDSGVMMGYYQIRGLPVMKRDVALAVDWARFISEKTPKLGLLLRKALKAYRNKDWPTAMFYYFLAAESGIEVATFNLAYLCDESHEGLTSYIEKECVWHYYNLSTLRHDHQIDSYALLKMGDYHWYGCGGRRDVEKAVMQYERAAMKDDPQAIFNLAVLVEEGVDIATTVWHHLNIPQEKWFNKYELLNELYERCQESSKSEAYIPCRLALFRVQFLEFWEKYKVAVKMSTALATIVFTMLTTSAIYSYLRRRVVNMETV